MNKEQWDDFISRLKHHNRGDGVNWHLTANPIFLVQKKDRIWGMDPEYADGTAWIDTNNPDCGEYATIEKYIEDLDAELLAALNQMAFDRGLGDYTDIWGAPEDDQIEILGDKGYCLEQIGYIDRWEYVTAHFTKEGAEAFIKRKGHDYPDGLRIYTDSEVYCPEFNMVIAAMLDGELQLVEL